MDRLVVQVEEDHLAKLVYPSQPVGGLIELIWNALDADADRVSVEFGENDLGGIDAVTIRDDGHGMNPDEAREVFRTLGGSWKTRGGRSHSKKRSLHGSEGKGRWRAFAVGGIVRWRTVAEVDERTILTVVEGRASALREFDVSDAMPTAEPTGTTVTISAVPQDDRGLRSQRTVHRLMTTFALHLEKYPVTIIYAGKQIDPTALQRHRAEYALPIDSEYGDVVLTVIEWSGIDERLLYLCDADGATLGERRCPGFC